MTTEEGWQQLFATADAFAGEAQHAEWVADDGFVPYPRYSAVTLDLLSRLQTLTEIAPFDWAQWGGLDRHRGGAGLADAPVTESLKLVVALQRAERFGDGTIDAACSDGTVQAIVDRVRAWHRTLGTTAAD